MEYYRITSIQDPFFKQLHQLMQAVFPSEEVLEFDLWKEPLEDPDIRVFVAVQNKKVLGATEYRYYEDFNIAMTDFTIIGQAGLGIGPFLSNMRLNDLNLLVEKNGNKLFGMFAEIYDPYQVDHYEFGSVKPMDPYVRREVLSHLGYKRLDFPYVHPSWNNDGESVTGIDLCFLPVKESINELQTELIVRFLKRYYTILSNRPKSWYTMIENLERIDTVTLLPI
ncbi:GNAT family N-acetyltransferase [Bacillus sp. EB600]|uniref:GNAT family N-acetyltransferase n=1 Tax=Bacillus sp. EB600 TaxID=2806345 RepID=UPI00210EF2F3|nr:GNAT family N-acetyltransferase [Bacillus sp. EB600]MCQ6281215.1 GNAT family N-acetyltransferase [Bacillus sp. EB600]